MTYNTHLRELTLATRLETLDKSRFYNWLRVVLTRLTPTELRTITFVFSSAPHDAPELLDTLPALLTPHDCAAIDALLVSRPFAHLETVTLRLCLDADAMQEALDEQTWYEALAKRFPLLVVRGIFFADIHRLYPDVDDRVHPDEEKEPTVVMKVDSDNAASMNDSQYVVRSYGNEPEA